MTTSATTIVDQHQREWKREVPKARGRVLQSALPRLVELGKGAVSIAEVDDAAGFAEIVYRGRPWGIEAVGILNYWPGFWQLRLHDLTGPVQDDGSQGQQAPGVVVKSTPADPDACMPHHIGYLWDFIRKDQPTLKTRMVDSGSYPFGTVNLWDGHTAECRVADLYLSRRILREITTHAPGRAQWTIYATKKEPRRALTFLAWLLLGYDPPDKLLLLENCHVAEVWEGAPSMPVTWSEWQRRGDWSLREVWTVQAAQAELRAEKRTA
jgi:hypothetical protein